MIHPPDGKDSAETNASSVADETDDHRERDQVLVHLVDLAKESVDGPLTMLTVRTEDGGSQWIGADHLDVSDICRERLVAEIVGEDVPPATEVDNLLHPEVISDVLTIDPSDSRLRWIAVRIADRGALIACDWEPWDPDERVAAILIGFAHFIEQELVRREFRQPKTDAGAYEEFKDLILNSARDGVIGLNLDGTCRFVNEKAAELLGYPAEHLVEQPASRFFSRPGDNIEQELLSFQQGKRVDLDDVVLQGHNGEAVPVELSILPNIEHSGEITGGVLRFFDLSERKAALAAAQHSDARHQAFLEMTLDSIMTVDQSGRIIEFNQAAEKTFGCTSDKVLGQNMAEIVFPQPWRDWFEVAFNTLAETGTGPLSGRRIQMTALRFNGSTFPAELTIIRLPSQEGWIFTIYIHDLTERKWNERRRITRYAVTRILAEAESPTEALSEVVESICQSLEWDWAAIWTREPGATDMRIETTWKRESVDAGSLEIVSRQTTFEPGHGFLGEVWTHRQSGWISDLREPNPYLIAHSALACGFHSVAGMPMTESNQLVRPAARLGRADAHAGGSIHHDQHAACPKRRHPRDRPRVPHRLRAPGLARGRGHPRRAGLLDRGDDHHRELDDRDRR
jgi:PAS domain S-box-containing protein